MKLQCQVEVINRVHSSLNIRSSGKYLKSTLALGKEPKNEDYFLLHFSSTNKNGLKYKVKCLKQVFMKCLNEGKVTLRFEEPPHDICIKGEVIQMKSFMKLLKCCVTGESQELKISNLSSIGVTAKDTAPTKLVLKSRAEYPTKGLPRTLKSLYMDGLKFCNMRREILLLNHLAILDLSNNEIEKIPPEFGRMPSLCELYLSNNSLGLNKDPDWRWLFGPQLRKKLKLLDISGNNIQSLPKALWKLENLVTFKLNNNKLEKLPSSLGRIQTLRYLSVSNNKLQTLPISIMRLGLQELDISSNSLNSKSVGTKECNYTPWEFYVNNLVHISAKIVLKHKFFYTPNIIPYTLVELLDNANVCACGNTVLNDNSYIKMCCMSDIFIGKTLMLNVNDGPFVSVEFYFCSPKCVIK